MKTTSLFFLIGILTVSVTFSQDVKKYKFPITPASDEWKTNSYPERLKILSIEEETLKSLSNIELIGACMDYPYTINLYAFNSIDEGYINIYNSFNGLREIHNREAIGDDLIYFFSKMGINGFEKEFNSYNEYYDLLKFKFFEVILSREDIISKFDKKQKRQLVEECIIKYNALENDKQQYEGEPVINNLDKKFTLSIICKLLVMDGSEQDKQLAIQFMRSSSFNYDTINSIISISSKLY